MPTYEYECSACNHSFEVFQNISDTVKRKCPACGKLKLRRLIGTGAAVIFKGSGFYQTDYRSKEYHQKAKSENKAPCENADKCPAAASCAAKGKDNGKQPD